MVICGVAIDSKDEKKLVRIGVKDSKELTPKKREAFALEIEKIAKHIIVLRIPACKIYTYRKKGIKLNEIEAVKMAEIINMIKPDKVFIDSPGINVQRFKKMIIEHLKNRKIKMVAENFADRNYPIVSAASVIAKVERDKVIEEIKQEVGFDFGVGYSHDSRSIKFLEKILTTYKQKPNFVRWHWSTVKELATELLRKGVKLQPWVKKEILKESWQKRIKDFFIKNKSKSE